MELKGFHRNFTSILSPYIAGYRRLMHNQPVLFGCPIQQELFREHSSINQWSIINCRGDSMNAKIRQGIIFLIIFCLVLFVSSSFGQATISPDLDLLQAQIDREKETVAVWENKADFEFYLVILVVVLGALVAVLQKVERKKWCAYVVAVSGIMISTLTFATKEYFEVDHKTYRKCAATAKREISNAEMYLAVIKKPDIDSQHKEEYLSEVVKIISKIKSIAETIEKTSSVVVSSKNSLNFELIKSAYAQATSRPAWVYQPRTENSTSYFFVGVSSAFSLFEAQSQALFNAQNAAASGLSLNLDTVKKYSLFVDKYLEYDSGRRTYLFYAKIELNKAFVRR
jgi:hypothetical protein